VCAASSAQASGDQRPGEPRLPGPAWFAAIDGRPAQQLAVARSGQRIGRPAVWLDVGGWQIEPIEVHHLVPRGHEIARELLPRMVARVDFGKRPQFGVRAEHQIDRLAVHLTARCGDRAPRISRARTLIALRELVIHVTQARGLRPHLVVSPTLPGTAAKILDHGPVRNGLDLDGVLSEAVEEQIAMARPPTVEPERELVEVIVQMGRADGPLMRAQKPALEERRDEVSAWQQLIRRFRMVAEKGDAMPVAMRLQAVVPEPAIGVHQAAGLDDVVDERLQTVRRAIRDATEANPPEFPALVLHRDDRQDFLLRSAAAHAFLERPDERLVDLHLAGQAIPSRPDHCAS